MGGNEAERITRFAPRNGRSDEHITAVMQAAWVYDQSSEKAKRGIRRTLAQSIGRWQDPQLLYDEALLAQTIEAKETIRPLVALINENHIPDNHPDVKTLAVGFIVEYSKNKRVLAALRKWFDRPSFGNRHKGQVFAGIVAAEPATLSTRFRSFLDVLATGESTGVEHAFDQIIRSVGKETYGRVIDGLSKDDRTLYLDLCDAYRIGGLLRDLTHENNGNGSIPVDGNGGTVYEHEPSFFEARMSALPAQAMPSA